MKNNLKYFVVIFLLSVNLFACTQNPKFQNLGFEGDIEEAGIPVAWHPSSQGEMYKISVDKNVKFKGKQSVKIECKEDNDSFGAILQTIPAVYSGSVIKITAFLKLKDVESAIGLMLRIDGDNNQILQFDNMQQRKILGTIDWKEYSVSVLLPDEAKTIMIGIIQSGKGTLWADNISLSIDEKDYASAPLKKEKEQKKEKEPIVEQNNNLKIHPKDTIYLPTPKNNGNFSIERALSQRRSHRNFVDKEISLENLSQILWAAYGITYPINIPDYEFLRGGLRTAPSAGGLYPLDIYIVVGKVNGITSGLYKYISKDHILVNVINEDIRENVCTAALGQTSIKEAPISLIYTAVFQRTTDKYGERGRERYVCMDLGHSAENVYLQVEALGLGTCAIAAFLDDRIIETLELSKEEEPLYIMPIGHYIEEK